MEVWYHSPPARFQRNEVWPPIISCYEFFFFVIFLCFVRSGVLAHVFESLERADLSSSDIAAGLKLLRAQQKLKETEQARALAQEPPRSLWDRLLCSSDRRVFNL